VGRGCSSRGLRAGQTRDACHARRLAVVEVSPLAHTSPGPIGSDALAYRLWRLARQALRTRLQALGIGLALWEDEAALGPALEEVNAFRRSVRHSAAL
jgi:hypothetical protein